jgi:hypothetical protein
MNIIIKIKIKTVKQRIIGSFPGDKNKAKSPPPRPAQAPHRGNQTTAIPH